MGKKSLAERQEQGRATASVVRLFCMIGDYSLPERSHLIKASCSQRPLKVPTAEDIQRNGRPT
ncbi:hypothetical protein [Agarilytica rhodophyticola]|uniref:hypothetical protein n=1 Tax=Agarilytica rhodophyticola TaxID=1737490 RepID=UPI000B341572|nr:hypothetical protein [Agarilytica rhodophyticola]